MKIFRRGLQPAWTFRSDKNVWRLLPADGVLAVELRDTASKTAEYAGIDLASGSPLWQGLQFEDSWWVVMNRIFRDVLLLHKFVRPDMPAAAKIFAVDLKSGGLLWENEELTFLGASGDTVYGLRKSVTSEAIVGLDFMTGEQNIEFSTEDPRADEISVSDSSDQFVLPQFIEEIEESLSRDQIEILRKAPRDSAQNPTFIPSINGKHIVGFHTDAGKDDKGVRLFDSHVLVLDREGNLVYEDVADRKVYTAMGDFYFVAAESLFYVRDGKEIVSVRLV